MDDGYRVRLAAMEDAESIGAIGPAAYAESYAEIWGDAGAYSAHLETFGSRAVSEFLAKSDTRIWLVEYRQRPVGFLSAVLGAPNPVDRLGDGAEIPRIYLLAPARGRGLGARLMAEAERHARSMRATHLWLDALSCAPWAWNTYRRWGFVPIGETSFPGNVKPECKPMIVMRRAIAATG